MKILIVASDKHGRFAPFIEEQIAALEARGIEVLRYGITGKGILGYLRELPALRRLIRVERPDLIHAHYGLCGLLANLQRRIPVVTTYHGSDINIPSILRFSKIAMRLSAYNIFVSKRNVAIALKCKVECVKCKGTEDKVKGERLEAKDMGNSKADIPAFTPYTLHLTPQYTLLPCGVNLTDDQLQSRDEARSILGIDKGAKIVLFAGAFNNAVKDPALAQETLREANRIISQPLEGVDSSGMLLVLSSNNTTPQTNEKIELKELKGFNRTQVNLFMCAANALLMTSKTEGSPQVIKEAMACGCPIVSVDVGDVAERTSGVEGCYVVSTRDAKDIAEALLKAIAFEGKTNGRERIIEMGLSNEQVAKQLQAIYESILTDKGK